MSEFFYGWRRKAGCVLLVVAVVTMGMWMRCHSGYDRLKFAMSGSQHFVLSKDGGLIWMSWETNAPEEWSFDLSLGNGKPERIPLPQYVVYLRRAVEGHGDRPEHWIVYYTSIAIPLTLLSAFLILFPNKRKPTVLPQDLTAPESNSLP